MKILFISNELLGGSLCQQLLREGNDIKLYIGLDSWKGCLHNIVPQTDDWQSELSWVGKDGLIIFDDVGFGELQDELRAKGYRVVGGSAGGDRLELDREFFQSTLNSHGIKTLPSYNFDCLEEAIQFVKDNPDRWVIKQNGHICDLTYIGQSSDGKDVISILQNYLDSGLESVHLQQFVDGVEVGVGRYFNGENWIGPIEFNVEHKHLCNDDIGPLTGEMGTLMRYSPEEALPIFNTVMAPLKNHLKEIGFKGDFDINCIATEENIWPLEATARFGWPATATQCGIHQSPWVEFLSAVADGTDYDLQVKEGWGISVVIGTPPFPYQPETVSLNEETSEKSKVVVGFRSELCVEEMERLYFDQVARSDNEALLQLTGKHGISMQVIGFGKDIVAARDNVYSLVEKLIVPKAIYRTDIGLRFLESGFQKLIDWGGVSYSHKKVSDEPR